MHKLVILVVRADNKNEAMSEAETFMEEQINNVCDWYVIWWGWSGLLSEIHDDNIDRYNTNENEIVRLDECIDKVEKHKLTKEEIESRIENARENLVKARKKRLNSDEWWNTMDAYWASIYSNLILGNFSFESDVFNIDTWDDELPEEDYYKEHYAVVIDMHN